MSLSPDKGKGITPEDYLDLERRFLKVSDDANPENAAQDSYLIASLLGKEGGYGWPELLQHQIVIILGEPGSGKTTELRFKSEELRKKGKRAFFLRLDRIVTEPFDAVLGEEARKAFNDWQQGQASAFFFFDSVDESKLRKPDDFLTALERISDAINLRQLRRATLLFSSRISEWRPVTDLNEVRRRFPFHEHPVPAPQPKGKPFKDKPLVVQIVPLDPVRVRRYAQWRNLPDVEAFIVALDQNYAWEFARRPIDVNGLIEYWRIHKRLGNLTDLTENSIKLGLRESEGRETTDPLTPEDARQGAETLAAAAVFCRNLNFKVPDDALLPHTAALDPATCLPTTWRADQRRAILTRPLFDGATYGCIRFHHRRTLEYLAASWLDKCVRNGCPLGRLEDLLFAHYQGDSILRPSLAPVAAWLAIGDEPHNRRLRELLLKTEPDIFFKFGDPAQLSAEYKQKILRSLSDAYKDHEWAWIDQDPQTLARLAEPSLAKDVSELVLNRSLPHSLRTKMLLLVRYGRLTGCLDAALKILSDSQETDIIRQYAAAALRDCADPLAIEKLAEIAKGLPLLSNRLSAHLCETLYPNFINASELSNLIAKTGGTGHHQNNLQWVLDRHLQKALTVTLSTPLLREFIKLLQTEPYLNRYPEHELISQRYGWLCNILPLVLSKFLEQTKLNLEDAKIAAQGIRIIETYRDYRDTDAKMGIERLADLIKKHQIIKREYLWRGVQNYRSTEHREPEWLQRISGLFSLVAFDRSDIEWLTKDVRIREHSEDRELSLRFAFNLWQPYKGDAKNWIELLRSSLPAWRLHKFFWKATFDRLFAPAQTVWVRHIKYKLFSKHWRSKYAYKLPRARTWLQGQYILHRNLHKLFSGKATQWLADLSFEAVNENNRPKWTGSDWFVLMIRRGPIIAWATRHGCETAWNRNSPLLPHEEPDSNKIRNATITGLSGLHSLWRRGKLDFASLSKPGAENAARYGLMELNGFPEWLPELAASQPEAVQKILSKCIAGEWQIPSERQHVHGVLSKLFWSGDLYWHLIVGDLLKQLLIHDPKHPQVLEDALSIIIKSPNPRLNEVAILASKRVRDYQSDSLFFMAWMILWIQIDALPALDSLQSSMGKLDAKGADELILRLCDGLGGRRQHMPLAIPNADYLEPGAMRIFVPLMYRHIRPKEDIDRSKEGAYTPTSRDDAQHFRDGLLQRLAAKDHPDVPTILEEIADLPEITPHRDWVLHLIDEHIRQKVDLAPWQAGDIPAFASEYETEPRSGPDLFRIACWRLLDIKYYVERSENSPREEIRSDWNESALRRWLQRKLEERSRNSYTIPQEVEIDRAQRPDLYFECPGVSPVPVEIKWADNQWTAKDLLERLENQLVGQYMRAKNVCHGIYLVGYRGNKHHWEHPTERRRIGFDELVKLLENKAIEIEKSLCGVFGIRVISIDFTVPE
jgi:hypothetical protein